MNMKNFPITKDEKEFWVSRSVAVVTGVFRWMNGGKLHVLANRRGQGAPDFQGMWNLPCGYLDYDETLEQACSRELREETGCQVLDDENWMFAGINSDPKDGARQNVSIRYVLHPKATLYIPENLLFPGKLSVANRVGGEKDEVSEIKWVDLESLAGHQWAFGHDKLIPAMAEQFYLAVKSMVK